MDEKHIVGYNNLINQLKRLEFEQEDNISSYEYIKFHNKSYYIFKFFKDEDSIVHKNGFVFSKKGISRDDTDNIFMNFIDALDYLNSEFKAVLRKRKIESIL